MLKIGLLLILFLYSSWAQEYTMGKKTFILIPEGITKQTKEGEIIFYRNENNKLVGVSQKMIIKFKSNSDKSAIYREFELTQTQLLSEDMVVVTAPASHMTLDICSALQQKEEVEFAHPDFMYYKEKRGPEPLYNELWHLENNGQLGGIAGADINITGAWHITKGNDIKIAVIDDGFDTLHEDLKEAIVAQRDFDYNDNDASYENIYDSHGTLCSGIAVARENNKGVVGVAPKASLIAIKVGGKDAFGDILMVSDTQLISSFLWARDQGADIISCSWGTYNVSDGLKSTIVDLSLNGRGGKGIPIFFAAGNNGQGQSVWEHDEAALESVIAIGATTDRNERAYFSNYGPKLDLMAPGGDGYFTGIATTDISGAFGYELNAPSHPNYTLASDGTGFHGTSASAPMAAATAALMLSINPALTQNGVKTILQESSDKIGHFNYSNGRNDYFGYGKINAGAATKRAQESASFKQTLTVKEGMWNLMSLASNQYIYDITKTFGEKTWRIYAWNNQTSTWKVWASDRTCQEIQAATLECLEVLHAGEGFFIANYGALGNNVITLQGGKNYTSLPTITKGWNLIGLGSDMTLAQLKQSYGNLIVIWKMVNGSYVKVINDDDSVLSGEGFWLYLG